MYLLDHSAKLLLCSTQNIAAKGMARLLRYNCTDLQLQLQVTPSPPLHTVCGHALPVLPNLTLSLIPHPWQCVAQSSSS